MISRTFCLRRWHSKQDMTTLLLFLAGGRDSTINPIMSAISGALSESKKNGGELNLVRNVGQDQVESREEPQWQGKKRFERDQARAKLC